MDVLRAVARRAWAPPPPPPRPFWVCDQRGGRPRGLVAATLGELREQAGAALALGPEVTLVLAEDGTLVDTEGFFGALPPHTPLVALAPGQRWDPRKAEQLWGCWQPEPTRDHGPPPGAELARVTVALARPGPRDLLGRLRVTATIRGLRCDLGGAGPERLLREALRLLAAMTRAVGRGLLSVSALLQRLLEGGAVHGANCQR